MSQHPAVLIAERADWPLMRGQRAAKRAQTNKRQHRTYSKYLKACYSSMLSIPLAIIVICVMFGHCFSNCFFFLRHVVRHLKKDLDLKHVFFLFINVDITAVRFT